MGQNSDGKGSAFHNQKILGASPGKSLILVINFYFYDKDDLFIFINQHWYHTAHVHVHVCLKLHINPKKCKETK